MSKGKPMAILMKGGPAASKRQCIRMNVKRIRQAACVKYLGVSAFERMNFKVHIGRVRVKITNGLGQIKRVLKSEWGMWNREVRMIYERPFVACVVYSSVL